MEINLDIQISSEEVVVRSNNTNYSKVLKNILAINQDEKIISIGQSLDELIRENPQNEHSLRKDIHFEPIYSGPTTHSLENIHLFIAFEILQMKNKGGILTRLLNFYSISCSLVLPSYETIDEEVRVLFEYSLHEMTISNLIINNLPRGWERKQLNFLKISRALLFISLPVWFQFNIIVSKFIWNWYWFVRFFVFMMSFVLIYYLMFYLRIMMLKAFLPQDLLRSELLTSRGRIDKFNLFIVRNLLKNKH